MNIIKTRTDLLGLLPKGLRIAELGVFKGDFSKEILSICEPSKLYLVDLFEGEVSSGDKDGENTETVPDLNYHYQLLKEKYKGTNVEVIKGDTLDFLLSMPELDAVYIDSLHTFGQVWNELLLSAHLKYILGHDYDNIDVKNAVDLFCNKSGKVLTYLTEDKCPSYLIKENPFFIFPPKTWK
jgi:hypothetical protein